MNKPYRFAYVALWTSQPLSDKWVCDNHQWHDDNHIFLYSDYLAGEIFFFFFCFPRSFPQILTISGDSIRADIIFSTSWPVSVYTDTTITNITTTDTTVTTPATTVSNTAVSLTTDIYNYLLFFSFKSPRITLIIIVTVFNLQRQLQLITFQILTYSLATWFLTYAPRVFDFTVDVIITTRGIF